MACEAIVQCQARATHRALKAQKLGAIDSGRSASNAVVRVFKSPGLPLGYTDDRVAGRYASMPRSNQGVT